MLKRNKCRTFSTLFPTYFTPGTTTLPARNSFLSAAILRSFLPANTVSTHFRTSLLHDVRLDETFFNRLTSLAMSLFKDQLDFTLKFDVFFFFFFYTFAVNVENFI